MEEEWKARVGELTGAAVTSVIAGNPAPLVIAGAVTGAGWVTKWRSSVTNRVQRNFAKTTRHLSGEQRVRVLEWAADAVKATHLTIEDMALAGFDVDVLADRAVAHLDVGLSEDERKYCRKAIHLTYETVISEAQRDGSDLRGLSLATQKRMEVADSRLQALETGDRDLADPVTTSRGRIDARRLADPTHREVYAGDRDNTVLNDLSFSWPDEIRRHTEHLHLLLARGSNVRVRDAVRTLEALPLTGTYPTIWRALQQQEVTRAIALLLSTVATTRDADREVREQAEHLRWLTSQADSPEFALAFPVAGEWGAGKSRLLDRVAEGCVRRDWLPVHVDMQGAAALEDLVLRDISRAVGVDVRTPAALRHELETRDGACLLLDDWDIVVRREPRRRAELQTLIEDWSNTKVRWVLSIDESGLQAMLQGGADVFWGRYGCRKPKTRSHGLPITSGWLDLSDDNERTGLGLTILSGCLPDPPPELEQIRRGGHATRFVRRALSQPLTALLRADDPSEAPLDEIHLFALVSKYWTRMLNGLYVTHQLDPDVVNRICSFIACGFLYEGHTRVETLPAEVDAPLEMFSSDWKELVASTLKHLAARRILERSHDSVIPAAGLELVWGFLVARELFATVPELPVSEWPRRVDDMHHLATMDVPAATAAMRFVLLAAASADAHTLYYPSAYLEWLADSALPNDILWEATPALPSQIQQQLMAAAALVSPEDGEEFWTLRLVRLLEDPTSKEALVALAFAARVFPRVLAGGLSDYLLVTLQRVVTAIDWTSPQQAGAALSLLARVDIPHLAKPLAGTVVDRLKMDAREARDGWLGVLLTFLATVHTGPRSTQSASPVFWAELCELSLTALAEESGPSVLEELFESGWFAQSHDPTIDDHVTFAMRQIAHITFGHTWRRDHRDFLDIIDQLLDGAFPGVRRDRQTLAALFGIIHSVSTHGGDVEVSADFANAKARLEVNPYIRRSHIRSLQRIHIVTQQEQVEG